ncbi:MAG: TonB-dependent receptor plug domain-containing protein, partial [Bradyrhizobium sp.]
MFRLLPARHAARHALLVSAAVLVAPIDAEAQSSGTSLPAVTVTAPDQPRASRARPRNTVQAPRAVRQARNPAPPPQVPSDQGRGVRGALAVMSAQQALTEINNTPGGVALVPAAAYKNSTVANTIKDILDYVPGVFAQPKWGDDTRLSIRGSGLSRNFHLRGVQLYMDGIPINTADGYGDFQEIDPTAYKYVEVFKGANALQFGA